jgi:NarL family two-component system response regulator LiaR
MIKLAILEDNVQLVLGLRLELQDCPEFEWIVTAHSALPYVHGLRTSRAIPDVVLMDISMTTADEGIVATRYLHDHYPDCKVIMFTIADDDERIFEAFKAGAVGYLLKNENPSVILRTILEVAKGGAFMSPGIALKAIRFMAAATPVVPPLSQPELSLSDREKEILHLTAQGLTYQAMAEKLFLSNETVKKHMGNIFKKLHVKNKVEALNKARSILH